MMTGDALKTDQALTRTNWEAYYLAAHKELEDVRSVTTDQEIRDYIHAALADAIIMTLAKCYGSNINEQAKAQVALVKRCREKAMEQLKTTEDIMSDFPSGFSPETQTTIGQWANATFGGSGDPLSPRHCIRLLEEVVELCLAAGASRSDVSIAVSRELSKSNVLDSSWSASNPDLAKVPEEMADCEIVLRVLAHRRDVDLQSEVDKKMKINRSRKWKLNNDGTGYHIKEGEK